MAIDRPERGSSDDKGDRPSLLPVTNDGKVAPQLTVHGRRPWFLNPAVIFYGTWLGVWFLYSLQLSSVLLYPLATVSRVEIPLLCGFLPFLLIPKLLPHRSSLGDPHLSPLDEGGLLRKRLKFWFRVWIALTLVEIIVSGGVPLAWTLLGTPKDYFMFGIPTLHGFLNALILAISITRFTSGLLNGRRRDLLFPLFTIGWSIIVETRQMTIVLIVEAAMLFLMYRTLQMKRVVGGLAVVVMFVVLFGVSGDVRTGGEAFRALARPTERYPNWLPSGFLWVYIYMTTPLNNLVNTYVNVHPLGDITLPNTLAQLVPTAVRNLLGQKGDSSTWSGSLVTEAFNVSTAYAGPVQDLGVWGMAGFSAFAAFTTGLYWAKKGLRNNLNFAVLGQCLFLTIFFNHFFFLPIIAQILWLYIFFWEKRKRASGTVGSSPVLVEVK